MASTNSCQISETTPHSSAKNGKTGENKKKDGRCNPLHGVGLWSRIREGGKNKNTSERIEPPQADAAASTNSDANPDQLNPSGFREKFNGLSVQQKNCLLSFAVFPENAVVKKRLLVNWWIAEGFLDPSNNGVDLEDIATKILHNFMANNFILPVNKKRKKVVNRFKMDPVLLYEVITLAQEHNFFKDSDSERACLINGLELELTDPEKIKTLFNVSQGILDDSFSKMKNVQVLCLGTWQSSVENHHIEVENTESLEGLKNMVSLKLLSLEGISGIQDLPSSISKVRKLRFLNLRSCHNLESLPREIKSLKMLTHLDVSECYMLDHMPKELLHLSHLQVLKGFVITDESPKDVCTLANLQGLKELRKLSINISSQTSFIEELGTLLFKLKKLEKLHVAWGAGSKDVDVYKKKHYIRQPGVAAAAKKLVKQQKFLTKVVGMSNSKVLQKLDLQLYPQNTLPRWLVPGKLTNLKKLYIRGGGPASLGKIEERGSKWQVEVLRLKHLSELKIDWSELKAIFPKLNYLEKFNCPKVTFCPCDGSGLWLESSTN